MLFGLNLVATYVVLLHILNPHIAHCTFSVCWRLRLAKEINNGKSRKSLKFSRCAKWHARIHTNTRKVFFWSRFLFELFVALFGHCWHYCWKFSFFYTVHLSYPSPARLNLEWWFGYIRFFVRNSCQKSTNTNAKCFQEGNSLQIIWMIIFSARPQCAWRKKI